MISISMVDRISTRDRSPGSLRAKAIPIAGWRWVALLAVVVGVVHHRLYHGTGAPSLAAHLDGHVSSLAPAPAAFLTSTVIELMLICYSLAQLGEAQRQVAVYDRVSRLVVAVALLSSVRLTMIDENNLWITTAVSGAVAAASAVAYQRVRREIVAARAPAWVGMPFSLLVGWTTIIAVASLDAAIATAGSTGSAPAVILVALVAGAALYLGLQFRDHVLPGVVAWLLAGICTTHRLVAPIATVTLLAAALCAIVAIVIVATRISPTPPVGSPSPSRRSPPT